MTTTARSEWRVGWPVVAVSGLAMLVSTSHMYTFGLFIPKIETETAWSRSQVTAGLLIVSCVSVVLAPGVGYLVDRLGPRSLALPGVMLFCTGLASLSLAGSNVLSWYGLWLLVALGSVCIKPTVWTSAMGALFSSSRGLAFAVALAGTGLGGSLLPLLTEMLLQGYGWRTTYVLLGGGLAILVVPLVYLFFRVGGTPGRTASTGIALTGLDRKEALLSFKYFRLASAALLITCTVTALTVHFVPMTVTKGHARADMVQIAGLIGLASMTGRIFSGFLLDRIDGRIVGSVALGLPAIACLMLLQMDPSANVALAAALIIGFSLGAEIDIVAYLCSRHFGMRNYGVLFGTIGGLLSLGGGLGPFVGSFIFDETGSYRLMWIVLIPISLYTASAVASLGKYPRFEAPADLPAPQQVSASA